MRYARMLIILLVLVFCLQGCVRSQPVPKPQETDILAHLMDDFSKAIENGVPSDMRLTLYWEPPYLEQLAPYTRKEDFIRGRSRTLLNSTQLASQIDALKKIDSAVLQPPKSSQYKDINICYWIETDAAGTVLEWK